MQDHESESMVVESSMIATLSRTEFDQQIATAKKYPRSLKTFRQQAMDMATLDEVAAGECIYALPRDGKMIEGPSARFAEIIASTWGNCRAGARVVDDTGKFIVAQGVFHDLERNVAITYEVQRRITDKGGRRYKDDMVGVTANAACSIALRNAVLKGVPKAMWSQVYDAARQVLLGDVRTLSARRDQTMSYFGKMGVSAERVFALLDVKGTDDITLEHIAQLRGLAQAIRDGDSSIEDAFPAATQRGSANALNDRLDAEAGNQTGADAGNPAAQTVSDASLGDTGEVGSPGASDGSAPATTARKSRGRRAATAGAESPDPNRTAEADALIALAEADALTAAIASNVPPEDVDDDGRETVETAADDGSRTTGGAAPSDLFNVE